MVSVCEGKGSDHSKFDTVARKSQRLSGLGRMFEQPKNARFVVPSSISLCFQVRQVFQNAPGLCDALFLIIVARF